MLAFSRCGGPWGSGRFTHEYSIARHKCAGCGYLRISTIRNWTNNGFAPVVDNPKDMWDQIADLHDGWEYAWSQRVVDAVREKGFTGAEFHRMEFVSDRLGHDTEGVQPYYLVQITGRVTVDRNLYDGGDGFLCPECGVWKPRLEGTVRWGDKVTAIVDEGAGMPDFAYAANIVGLQPFMSIRAAQFFGASGFTGFKYLSLIPNYPYGGEGLGNPGADGWWEAYIEKVGAYMPPGCML